jgi:hypothetical protein
MFTFPVISWTHAAVKDVGTYVINKLKGVSTDQDTLRAAMALAPRWGDEFLKMLFTPEGGLTANPNQKDLNGNYKRDETERWVSSIIGMKPLNEAKIDAIAKSAREYIKLDMEHRTNDLDAIVSQMLGGKGVDPELLKSFIMKGGSPEGLQRSLMQRAMKHQLPYAQQQQLGGPSLNHLHNLQILNQYMDTLREVEKQKGPQGLDKDGNVKPISFNSDTERPQLVADKSRQVFRQPDSRYQGDIIDPQVNGKFDRQGRPMNPDFTTNKWTKDKFPIREWPKKPKSIEM